MPVNKCLPQKSSRHASRMYTDLVMWHSYILIKTIHFFPEITKKVGLIVLNNIKKTLLF